MISGADLSTAAFVGEGPDRLSTRPALLTSARALGRAGDRVAAAARHFFANGGRRLYLLRVAGVEQDPAAALARLDDLDDVGLVACPGHGSPAVVAAGAAYCEGRGDCFYVADPPEGAGVRDVIDFVEALPARSAYAALYFPWLTTPAGPAPPSGFVAGVYARSDARRGVWEAPAGSDAHVDGADGLTQALDRRHRDELNPLGVNTFQRLPGGPLAVWGARTLAASTDSEWKYVNLRRLAIFLERSIAGGTSWAVFEPNGEPLWARLRRDVEDFLTQQWLAGAFPGTTAQEAFFVTCDRTTMTQADVDAGRVIVVVGFAPARPAEFVILRIRIKTADYRPDP